MGFTLSSIMLAFAAVLLCGAQPAAAKYVSPLLIIRNVTLFLRDFETQNLTQIVPPPYVESTETCPDLRWKTWLLHKVPPVYDPLNWDAEEWKEYLVNYPLHSAGLSLAFLVIMLLFLGGLLVWRVAQWVVGCCGPRCRATCSVGAEGRRWLGDTKHTYLRAWIWLLLGLGLGMCVWGMLSLDEELMADFWNAVRDIVDYGYDMADTMDNMQYDLEVTVPRKLARINHTVGTYVDPLLLRRFAQDTLEPLTDPTTSAALAGLAASSSALSAALGAAALPPMEDLLADLRGGGGGGGGGSRRMLAASPSPSLASLLLALAAGLPAVRNGSAAVGGIAGDLQTLQSALAAVAAAAPGAPSAAALAALRSALSATTPAAWDTRLTQLQQGLQAYDASRRGDAYRAVAANATQLNTALATSARPLATQLRSSIAAQSDRVRAKAVAALANVRSAFSNISSHVVRLEGTKAANWTLQLRNAARTRVPLKGLFDDLNYLVSRFMDINGTVTTNDNDSSGGTSSGRRLLQQAGMPAAPNDFTVGKLAQNLSATAAGAASLAAPLSNLSAAATAAAATGGPDPAAATTHVTAALLPAAATLPAPTASVSAAATAYAASATDANLQALYDSIAAANPTVAAAAANFSAPLPDAAALAAAAAAHNATATSLAAAAAAVNGSLSNLYDVAVAVCVALNTTYQPGVTNITAFLLSLPGANETAAYLHQVADNLQNTIFNLTRKVNNAAVDAGQEVDNAETSLREDVLAGASDFVDDTQGNTEDMAYISYCVWMGCWGGVILLILLYGVFVILNCPGGLVTVSLLLACSLVVSQVMCSALAFGMAVLADACDNIEQLALEKVLTDPSYGPGTALLLSYYLYENPTARDLVLTAALGFNETHVRSQAALANTTLQDWMDDNYEPQGEVLEELNGLGSMSNNITARITNVLQLLSYDRVNPMYITTREVLCCAAGTFAYNQWMALTIATGGLLGALIAGSYLLARLDMLGERSTRCFSCCACACYRGQGGGKVDEEAATDEVAAAAHDKLVAQKLAHEAAAARRGRGGLGATPEEAAAGGRQGGGGVSGGTSGASGAEDPEAMPTGFATAAGGAAAAAALHDAGESGGGAAAYSAPSAHAMAK